VASGIVFALDALTSAGIDGLTTQWRKSPPVFDLLVRRTRMPSVTTLKAMRRVLVQGVFVAVLTALIGFHSGLAAQEQRLWSIVIHFQYQDGFEFDYVLERGVSTANVGAALADCGRSHRNGSVVYYHCYPVPE
jgi:hypothetical protein